MLEESGGALRERGLCALDEREEVNSRCPGGCDLEGAMAWVIFGFLTVSSHVLLHLLLSSNSRPVDQFMMGGVSTVVDRGEEVELAV